MSEKENTKIVELSEKVKALESVNKKQEIALAESEFTKKYVGKKILPSVKDSYFKLFMSNKEEVTKILDNMKDLNLTEELGTSDDIKAEVIKDVGDARKLFDSKALALAEKEKIDSVEAAYRIRKEMPELYNKAYPAPVVK